MRVSIADRADPAPARICLQIHVFEMKGSSIRTLISMAMKMLNGGHLRRRTMIRNHSVECSSC